MAERLLYIGNKLVQHGGNPTGIDFLGELLASSGYDIKYAGTRKGKIARFLQIIVVLIKNRNWADTILIDTYSTLGFYFALTAAVLCRIFNTPYICILRGGNLPARLKNSPGLSRFLFTHSKINVAVSPYIQRSFCEAGYKTLLIPNPIVLNDYIFKDRKDFNPDLLWVRSFHKIYNPEMAVKVLAQVKTRYPGATLKMVGPDKDGSLAKVRKMIKHLQLDHSVVLTGRLSKKDWISLSASCGIFINTTNFDNMPVSVLEAMALGIPVVSTNAGGVPDLIENETEGLLINTGDWQAMSDKIFLMLQDKAMTYNMCVNARHKAEQFGHVEILKAWKNVLDSQNDQR